MLTEIIKSCGYAPVAEAAVRSIGGRFAEEVRSTASERGLALGEYAAAMVRCFDRKASADARRSWDRSVKIRQAI